MREDVFFGGGSPTNAIICSGSDRNLEDKVRSIREEILLSLHMQRLPTVITCDL